MTTGYELDDDKFDLFMKAGMLKMDELGRDHTPENFLLTLKEWFHVLTDEATVAAYVDATEAALAAQHRDALEAALAALDD